MIKELFIGLQTAGLKKNPKKSHFRVIELEYLGYHITHYGIQPIPKKLEAIQNINPPKTSKQLRKFISMINYYRDMWRGFSDFLAPLSEFTSKKVKFKWNNEHHKFFMR